jgi:hypothetical protein
VAPLAVGAEVAMTLFVLPGLLNIPPKSPLGVAVACTPLVATEAVKHALDWLFAAAASGRSRIESGRAESPWHSTAFCTWGCSV